MSKSLKIGLGIVIILLTIGLTYVFTPKSVIVGTAVDCTQNTCFTSLGVTGTAQFDGALITNGTVTNNGVVTNSSNVTNSGTLTQTGDATFNGGNGAITVTTSNSATSTLSVGCIQMYATSTATAVRLTFGTNAWATSTTQGSNATGLVAWQYGSCPI